MKIFGREFFKSSEPLTQSSHETVFKETAFSTPFLSIGEGNLSMPNINKYYKSNNIVRFGSDNLYPQLLNQMYYTSSIHGACIDYIKNATIGGGYRFENEVLTGIEKVKIAAFEKTNKFKKMAVLLASDLIIHKRVTVLVQQDGNGNLIKLKRLDPSTIRNNADNTEFAYSSDWSRGQVDSKIYKRFEPGCNYPLSLYVYQEETPGQDIYPIPMYNSILNLAYLDGEQAFFHKSNIQNSVFPSLVIRRPKDFSSQDEAKSFKDQLSSNKGSKSGGKAIILTGNGFDDVPEVIQIKSNDNDKLFTTTQKTIKNDICIAHKINPLLMGIKVEGSLGNASELNAVYPIFEKNVVLPLRNELEEILNDLIDIANLQQTLVINNFQIIEDEIVDKTNKIIKDGILRY